MKFNELIEKGLHLVKDDPLHDLRVGVRCQLLLSSDRADAKTFGHQKRVRIAILSVQKVLPLWELEFSKDPMPYQAVELTERVISGGCATTIAEKEIGKMWTHCDNLSCRFEDKQNIIMVGYGAIQTVREALSERHFGCDQVNDNHSDSDIDPYDHDSSFCASVAYCGGPTWDSRSDPQKRLEFWTWWLRSLSEMCES